MNSGFGVNLEGFLIKGNLSLIPSENPYYSGDGSLESAGALYVNKIKKYDASNNGITVNTVEFRDDHIFIPHYLPSTDTAASFIINGGITIKDETDSTGLNSGGGLTILGGASIRKKLNVGGELNVNGNRILNVAWPDAGGDATNRDYVDSVAGRVSGDFTTGQLIIASSVGDSIRGYDSLTFDGSSLGLGGNRITNVGGPLNATDVATKAYVDDAVASGVGNGDGSGGSISGNFSAGQVIIGGEGGEGIVGYDTFKYTDGNVVIGSASSTQLIIANTQNAYSVSGSGALIVQGGAVFDKNVYIDGQLDVNYRNIKNVATPIHAYDAVNKAYIDDLFGECECKCEDPLFYESEYILNNSQFEPIDLVSTENKKIIFKASTKAFVSYIYVENIDESNGNGRYSLYTLRGINRGTAWYLSSSFVGDIIPVDFFIKSESVSGDGYLQYSNTNTDNSITKIKFRTYTLIKNTDPLQIQETLSNATELEEINRLRFFNNTFDSVKIILHVTDAANNKHGMYFMSCILKGNVWTMNTYVIGNITGLNFVISSGTDYGQIKYRNKNATGEYVIRSRIIPIHKQQQEIVLVKNNDLPVVVDQEVFSYNSARIQNFQDTIFVSVPGEDKSAVFEIEGIYGGDTWRLNSRYTGDRLDIYFSITPQGLLKYKNLYSTDAYIKYIKNTPPVCEPLPVIKGGTGSDALLPYAVLRGNGKDPIIGTEDFIYQNYKLILGDASSILLLNSSEATSTSSGGAIISRGGVGIDKNLIVGESINVKGVDITPSIGDISAEREFSAGNNVQTPSDITGFTFTNPEVKSFTGVACVTVIINDADGADDIQYDTLYEIKALRKKSGWILTSTEIGDDTGIVFNITQNGQIQYISPDFEGLWDRTIVKFRGITTSMPI